MKLSWNRENIKETALAEKIFREYVRKGWLAFVVTEDNRKKQVFIFDPRVEEIHLVRPIEGG